MTRDRVAAFVRDQQTESFGTLALAAFRFQYERVEPYRRLCAAAGAAPNSVTDWRRIPAVPTLAYKGLELAADTPREIFRSSGTRGVDRSVHRHPYPDLYRLTIDHSFPRFCLPPGVRSLPILSLVPSREETPDSSLSFMVDHILESHGDDSSTIAFGPRGVAVPAARSWLSSRQRGDSPVLVLATALALADLLAALARRDLRFRLPAGSVVFVTGGFKGRDRASSFDELTTLTDDFLGIDADRMIQEYGMTELTSQFYTEALAGGDRELFVPPHWTRVQVLDPETLTEVPEGDAGLLAVFDLANLGSAVHVLTEDLGRADSEGFHLVGRADDAELRGCSLTVEELTSSSCDPREANSNR